MRSSRPDPNTQDALFESGEPRPRLTTLLAQAGTRQDTRTGALSTPIHQTATFAHPGLGQSTGFDYSRSANPTRAVLERTMARLDGGAGGFAFASGLAALTTVLGLFEAGDHLVVAEGGYGGTQRLLDQVFARFGLALSYLPVTDTLAYRSALGPRTRAILVEAIANPCLQVPDLPALAALAREAGVLLLVDNTFLTPYWLRPLELGADLVLHSASKFLAGHNDVIAGIVTVRTAELADRLGYLQNALGAVLAPQEAWLVLRGLKTLALRLERQQTNALAVAQWLRRQPAVVQVRYPGLPDDPSHRPLARFAEGFGAVLAFEVDDAARVERLIGRLRLIAYAESLGGVESLITVPALQTHANLTREERDRLGIRDTLLRLSVGIEDAGDLIADLAQALA
ncbi:trans-sulfuration enzyme family protein [Candidatus Methylocalor cossyra]|uniref:Cystathionine gamma-lyase n=1 Tax=Candidatus Methylocalor cossyra TaxID=3108543 RepID=A0ABP1C5P9_9GAMM